MSDTDTPELLGTSDVAKRFSVTSVTVTRWAASGELPPAGRLGSGALVFNRSDVDTFAAKRANDVESPAPVVSSNARSVF